MKKIEWSTRPLTVQEIIWLGRLTDMSKPSLGYESIVELAISRSDGQLSRQEILDSVSQDFRTAYVSGLAESIEGLVKPDIEDLWRRSAS